MGRAFKLAAAVAVAIATTPATAQDNSDQLAKQLSNPIANLISVPFQFNGAFGGGPDDDGQWYTLNIQPVVPVNISPEWNVIVRTIVPVVWREDAFPTDDSVFGLGNTLQSFFFSPKAPTAGGLVWGVGPAFNYPTATDDWLGSHKWGAGPTAVALLQKGPWTTGILWNHIWSFDGADNPGDINASFFQPFLAYSLGKGRTLSANVQASYDWIGDEWTAPMNIGYSKVFKVGEQPMSFQVAGTYYLASPEGGPEWGFQSTLTLLFPKGGR